MASITTKNFDAILVRCGKAVTAREAIGAPVSRKRFKAAGRGETAKWACSDAGQAALKEIIEALRIERKALNKLRKAARELARADEPTPQAIVPPSGEPAPGKAPAPRAASAPTKTNPSRKIGPGTTKPMVAKASVTKPNVAKPKAAKPSATKPRATTPKAVAERPRTVVGKTRPGARKRGTSAGKPL